MPNESQPRTEEQRHVKESLNAEGWDGDNETGAAVFVGTKEEAELHRARLEQEGNAVDMRTYIHLHATQFCTADEIPANWKLDNIPIGTAYIADSHVTGHDSPRIFFKDKTGGIKQLDIDTNKIETLRNVDKNVQLSILDELTKLGFKDLFRLNSDAVEHLKEVHAIVSQQREARAITERDDTFDF